MKKLIMYFIPFIIISCQTKTNEIKDKNLFKIDTLISEPQQIKSQFDTLLNSDGYLVISYEEELTETKVVNEKEIDDYPKFEIIDRYRDDAIIGKNIKYANIRTYKKYQLKTTFKDYPVNIYKGELIDPDFSTDPNANLFKTRIKSECANGINFAGHYTLVIWGCGSPCQSGVVVDRKTGEIHSGYGTVAGSEFRKDSKMIIMNIGEINTTNNLIEICASCGYVSHEIWTGTEFEEVE